MVDIDQVNKVTEESRAIYLATEEALENDWDQKENLQFPNLLTFVMQRLKVDPKNASDIDPHMRGYVRKHPKYYVSRGAKGGIMLMSVYMARQAKKAEVESAKKDLKAQVDAKVAASTAPTNSVAGDDADE